MRLLGNRILVAPLAQEERKSEGGLYIPETAARPPETAGEVKVLGEKTNGEVKVGDTVFFSPFVGQELEYDSERYFIIREEDILAVMDS